MRSTRVLVLIWLCWTVLVIGFQAWATARLTPQFPDYAQEWTSRFTAAGYQEGHVYLLEPFMNDQVAWDSEYYLAIAVGGYDDPRSPQLTPTGVVTDPEGYVPEEGAPGSSTTISLSYAFLPLYPLLMRIVAFPLQILGMNAIATATLAGVIVSALGTLAGMLALYDLARESLGEDGALRAAFYLIVFPTGFFLLQVYTEGLFVGLAFGCLAMLQRKHWLAAALLGMAATMTRAVGVLLVIPMLMIWIRSGEWKDLLSAEKRLGPLGRGLLAISPVLVFLAWRSSYLGQGFASVESNNYQRGFLSLGLALPAWWEALLSMLAGTQPQHSAYYLTEFLGLAIGLIATCAALRTHPEIAWFSLAVIVISWTSGPAQGIHRYVLGAPAVFITLARWGRQPVFDRAWTLLSILLMGTLAMLFAFDMWVA